MKTKPKSFLIFVIDKSISNKWECHYGNTAAFKLHSQASRKTIVASTCGIVFKIEQYLIHIAARTSCFN